MFRLLNDIVFDIVLNDYTAGAGSFRKGSMTCLNINVKSGNEVILVSVVAITSFDDMRSPPTHNPQRRVTVN